MHSTTTHEPPSDVLPTAPRTGRRRWLFRLAAIILGLSPLVAAEALCTAFDWGRPAVHDDPFVGFRSVRPLFVLNGDETRYEIPKSRHTYFRPESFAAAKAPREFRIFCLGESTVQGNPWTIETSFTTWLELALAAADPSRTWEVVNCGGISYASYRLAPILAEVLAYQPDLIIICVGHNEFLEARTFDHVAGRGAIANAALDVAAQSRTFTLVREGYLRLQGRSSADPPDGRPILTTEVEALLDYRGGLEQYHHDEAGRQGVIAQYRFNVRRMVEAAQAAGVDVLLVNPVSNFSDSPPFKSEHGPGLTPAERAKWEAVCNEAREHLHGERRNLRGAAQLFEEACRLDPLHAGGWYNLAKCREEAGEFEMARNAYLQAKDVDVCPLRILQPMSDALLQIARDTGTPLLDAQGLFDEHSPHGITGGQWLVDHVHPSIEGHQLLADTLLEQLASLGKVAARADWKALAHERYREHYASLGNLYFIKGTKRLEALRGWAAGRAERVRMTGTSAAKSPQQSAIGP
ncbi:MAG: GDSL-type esterase/lipase family protein [Pirellulales bacterium]